LVESLVAVVLMGLTVTAVVGSVRMTAQASALDRDHAIAYEWLHAGSDEIYRRDRLPCDANTNLEIQTKYDEYANAVERPAQWDVASGATIVVENVEYLGRASQSDDFEWSDAFCFEGGSEYAESPLYTQRVTLRATDPAGDITRTLQMVKSE